MNRKNLVNYILAVLVITFMVFLSELLGEKEIIFPELAALSVGSFVLAALPWVVDGKRMILYIFLSAVCGVLIVLFLPGHLYFQMIVAYALSQVIFLLSRTTMAPMISAIVLPVKAVLLITLCATTGMVFRFILTVKAGLPLTLVAALVASVTFLIMRYMKMYLPPAAAMGVLALLIPEEKLPVYPLQAVVVITCLLLFAKLIDKFRFLFRKK